MKNVEWIKESKLWLILTDDERASLLAEMHKSKPYGATAFGRQLRVAICNAEPHVAICSVFSWSRTKLGHAYWLALHASLCTRDNANMRRDNASIRAEVLYGNEDKH